MAGSTLQGIAAIAQAFALGALIVDLIAGRPQWQVAAGWLLAIALVRALGGLASDYAAAQAAGRISSRLRGLVIRAALNQGYDETARRRAGELGLLATRGVSAVEPYVTRYLPALVVAAVLPVLTVIAILSQDWLSAIVVICTLPLIPVFAALIGLATQEKSDQQWRTLSVLSGHFLDVVRGLPTLVAYRRAGAQSGRIRQITDAYRRTTNETLKVAFLSSAALELIATISVALVAVTVGLRLAHGTLDFRTALVVLLMAPEAYWPLRRVGAEFHAAAEGTTTFAKIHELLIDSPAESPDTKPLPRGALLIDHLHAGYAEREVLHDVTATIPERGLTAIVGPSGCGKSTLLAALLGELPVQQGTITVGGVPISDHLAQWRAQVAHVGQRPWLISGTIADNVRIADPDLDDEAVVSALRAVELDLPLDHEVGEDGHRLSAGQRARLALARVVAADRPWVLLDEPTAHLDAATEAALLRTLQHMAQTRGVIVVAHRTPLIEAATTVLELPSRRVGGYRAPSRGLSRAESGVSAPATFGEVAAPRTSRAALGAVLASLASGFGVALTATAGWLIARAAEQPPVLYLMVAIVSVRLFGLGRPALRYLERLVTHDDALRLLADRRAKVYDVVVPLVPARLGRRRGDLLTSIVDDVDALVDERLRVRLPRTTWLLLTAIVVAVCVLLQPQAALVVALGSLLSGVVAWSVAYWFARRSETMAIQARAALSAAVVDTVSNARSLVLWQRDQAAVTEIGEISDRLSRSMSRSALGVGLGRAVATLGGALGVVAVALAVAGPLGAGDLSGPVTALLVLLPIAMVDVVSPLADAGSLAVRTASAAQRVDHLSQIQPAVIDPASPTPLTETKPDVTLRNVSVGWTAEPVLSALDLTLRPGRRLGIVGPSGCGKSTVAALLMRFLSPLSGIHRVAGLDVTTLTADDVRRTTALVDDDPYVFSSTLAENVRLARPEADNEAVESALRAAHLGAWLDSLAAGLSTLIGEGHAQVSGGERARLGLARALLADPAVLVLDEPTAHLDTETAHAVTDDLLAAAEGRTIVWITHGTVGLDQMDEVLRF